MTTAIERNGRVPGQHVTTLYRRAKDRPCSDCGTPIEKLSDIVGSCHVCPSCQLVG